MGPVSNQLWRLAGAVLCLLLIAGEAAAEICIDVDLRFAGPAPSAVTVRAMRNETSAIWEPYGVHLQWSPARDATRCPRVQGSFDVLVESRPSPAAGASRSSVLGSTYLAPAGIHRAPIHIDYDATERLVEFVSASRLTTVLGYSDAGPADVGRALGRVLAHEIGHVVLGASCHQAWGLMRSRFEAGDLVARQRGAFTLSRREIERLRQRERVLNGDANGVFAAPIREPRAVQR
jgi:hypothetical protein